MLHEIDSFVNKFKGLWLSGKEAKLQIDSKNGEAWLSLCLGLKCPPPPPSPPYHPSPRPRSFRNTPSQQRRRNRRIAVRETAAAKATYVEKDVDAKTLATEKVAVEAAMKTRSAEDAKVPQNEESNQAEAEEAPHHHVHDEESDAKTQFKRSEANAAEKADLADDLKENNHIENISKSLQNMSEATSGHQQFNNWLVCNYCDQSFVNEGLLRDHTEINHGSRRIRYRRR